MYRTVLNRPQPERDALYSQLIDRYSSSAYANEARKSLGLPVVVAQVDTAAVQFEQAEQLAEANDLKAAVQLLKRTAVQYPLSPFAPRSLYAAGWHYEHTMNVPHTAYAVYQRLVSLFPSSSFAGKVRGKIMEYDAEKKRIEEEKKEAERAEAEAKAAAEELKKGKKKPAVVPAPTDSTGTQELEVPSDTLSTPNDQL